MKNKKMYVYLLSGLIPLIIFFIAALLVGYLPLGKYLLNIYDSFVQYSGIVLEYKNMLLHGNIFYSWNAGLGFNFFGTMTYYLASPLNLLCIFTNTQNYPYFVSIMTYLRVFLLGISMCFYLDKRGTKKMYIILFSTIYALMGFTSTYYYNYLWIDSIIALPLVIHGLDKLIGGKSPKFYIFSLAITIILNYYIGYMICIFSLIYFIYRAVIEKVDKNIIKTFIISSILSGLMASIVIVPSFFALLTGKSSLYNKMKYAGITENAKVFFYTLTSGAYAWGDQSYGPAQVYTSILVLVLSIYYFFNKNFSKREKLATFMFLLFFYLSFSIKALNFAWQFFQQPIWWNSRFSFTFSFFMIITSIKTLESIDKTNFKISKKIIIFLIFTVLFILGKLMKTSYGGGDEIYTYIFLGFTILLFGEMMFLLDKKIFLPIIISFTFLDLSLNTFNSLKENNRGHSVLEYAELKKNLPNTIEKLNRENDNNFYRFEMLNYYTANDGMYFNYHGINYSNSARNNKVIEMLKLLGINNIDNVHVTMRRFDPVFLSLFNIKYIYGSVPYFNSIDEGLSENPYPLSIAFATNSDIKNLSLSKNEFKNKNNIVSSLIGENLTLYKKITSDKFITSENVIKEDNYFILKEDVNNGEVTYSFVSDNNYLLIPSELNAVIFKNDEQIPFNDVYIELKKGDNVSITYKIYRKTKNKEVYSYLLDLNEYENAMKKLSKDLMTARVYENGHILEGYIDVENNDYLFTTIEYESGMKIYVDGKEVKPDVIMNALVGFQIDEGHHTIVIDYTPKGFILGVCISGISFMLSFIVYKPKKRQYN